MSNLLDESVMGWVGHQFDPVVKEISRDDIRKFAVACRLSDPAYFDAEAARVSGYREQVAPTFAYLLVRFGPNQLRPRDDLLPDGRAVEDLPPVPLTRSMAGTTRVAFHERIYAGDTITMTRTLTDITQKEGRGGPLIFLEFCSAFRNQDDVLVVEEWYTRIMR